MWCDDRAMSQTVSALRREGLVHSVPGRDARTREVALTERSRAVVSFLEDEWTATSRRSRSWRARSRTR